MFRKKPIEKKEFKRGKLSSTRQKKCESNMIELKKNLDVLMNSRNELEKTLIRKNDELTNTEERIRAIKKCGEINPFDFHDVPQDNEIDVSKFLDIAESNIVLYENEPIVNIIIDADKDSYPFILNGVIKIEERTFC